MKTQHKTCAVLAASTLGLAGIAFASRFGDERYIYDASGNIVEKHIDDQVTRFDFTGNQIRSSNGNAGAREYQYDASGRLTVIRAGESIERKMEYQYLDKVTKVVNDDITTELYYNAEGQLVGVASNGGLEVFTWDGQGLAMRGEISYVIENHISGGLPVLDGEQAIISDYLGSTLCIGKSNLNPMAYGDGLEYGFFTGKPYVTGIDAFVFNYRNFSPDVSRWMSSDPIGFPDGSNNLAYASCPTTSLDLYGLLDYANAQDTSQSTLLSHASGAEWWADIWTAQTDDNANTVVMYKFQSLVQAPPFSPYNLNYNCHGYVHGGSQFWINDDMSPRIILGDGWKEVEEAAIKANGGPYIAVYFVSAHSVKVTDWDDGNVTLVTGKSGVMPSPLESSPVDAWPTGPIQFYEK